MLYKLKSRKFNANTRHYFCIEYILINCSVLSLFRICIVGNDRSHMAGGRQSHVNFQYVLAMLILFKAQLNSLDIRQIYFSFTFLVILTLSFVSLLSRYRRNSNVVDRRTVQQKQNMCRKLDILLRCSRFTRLLSN